MKTAKEVLHEQHMLCDGGSIFNDTFFEVGVIEKAMIEFAKLHIQEALKAQRDYINGVITHSNVFAYDKQYYIK